MADFIRTHLIKIIKEEVKKKQKILNYDEGFFYFDKPIDDGNKIINRLNNYSIYTKDEILPIGWYHIKGTSLLEVYSKLKDEDVYIYKKIDGKSHKIRIRKKK